MFVLFDVETRLSLRIFLERTKGVEFYAGEIQNIYNEKIEWKGVKQINNIEYIQGQTASSRKTSTEIRVWQSWKVGPGKLYRLCDLQKHNVKINTLNVFFSTNTSIPWVDDYCEKAGRNIIFVSKKFSLFYR